MAKGLRVENGVDRISALPDELLCHILAFLPTKKAVCTSVLSTRWRYLYTLVSSLNFFGEIDGNGAEQPNRFMNFVERVLLFRSRPSVEKFHLELHCLVDPLRVYGWIHALMWHDIRELDLCNLYYTGESVLQLPASLFSCKTLVVLKLGIGLCLLSIPARPCLPNLKFLHIGGAFFSGDDIGKLLSSCPALEDLVLQYCRLVISSGSLKINISIATLKRLTVSFTTGHKSKAFELMINSPALAYLSSTLPNDCSLVSVAAESLEKVAFSCYTQNHASYANAHDMLRGIKNIQSLQLTDSIIQSLDRDHNNLHLPLYDKLTYLKICIWGCLFDCQSLEYLLARCIVLETLVFEHKEERSPARARTTSIPYLLQQSRLNGLLCHLKTIEVKVNKIDNVEALMRIIEFFLNNAEFLEKLTVGVRQARPAQLLKIKRKLLRLPRVSQKCGVFVDKLS